MVVVTDERTLQERTQKREREEGKIVPISAVMDMKVSLLIPLGSCGDWSTAKSVQAVR